ncbi:unnamed protein product [Sympodiomycopsis kandeliae]
MESRSLQITSYDFDHKEPGPSDSQAVDLASTQDLQNRGFAWDLLTLTYKVTKIGLGATWWGAALNLGGLACSVGSLGGFLPDYAKYPCSALAFIGAFGNVFSARSTIAGAWSAFQGNGAYEISEWELGNWIAYGEVPVRRSAVTPAWFGDWEKYLEQQSIDNWEKGGLSIHQLDGKMSLLPWHVIRNTTRDNPIHVATSRDNKLHNWHSTLWFENGIANKTVIGSGSVMKQVHRTNKLSKRAPDCPAGAFRNVYLDSHHDEFYSCEYEGQGVPVLKYTAQAYLNEQQFDDIDYNAGAQNADTNGLKDMSAKITNSAWDQQWHQSCMAITNDGDGGWVSSLIQLEDDGVHGDVQRCN